MCQTNLSWINIKKQMVLLGLTCRLCRTYRSAGDCSFPSASAAPWSSPPVCCPQSADACNPGKPWRGSHTPGCSLQQGNLHRRGSSISQPNEQHRGNHDVHPEPVRIKEHMHKACTLSFITLLPPKKSWLPVVTRNEGLAWAVAPSSPSTATVRCPRLKISSTECHCPSSRAEPDDTHTDTVCCTQRHTYVGCLDFNFMKVKIRISVIHLLISVGKLCWSEVGLSYRTMLLKLVRIQ